MQDSIEKTIDLKAPVARVWRALTDYQQFGEWFRVDLDGPFAVGSISRGQVTYPGYEHLRWEALVKAIEPETYFAFDWCPYNEPDQDITQEPTTLVEFRLEPIPEGTRLHVSESGFNALPDDARRLEAFRLNTQGWDEEAKNIAAYVES